MPYFQECKCLQCDHKWTPRQFWTPERCPKCKRKDWVSKEAELVETKHAYYKALNDLRKTMNAYRNASNAYTEGMKKQHEEASNE